MECEHMGECVSVSTWVSVLGNGVWWAVECEHLGECEGQWSVVGSGVRTSTKSPPGLTICRSASWRSLKNRACCVMFGGKSTAFVARREHGSLRARSNRWHACTGMPSRFISGAGGGVMHLGSRNEPFWSTPTSVRAETRAVVVTKSILVRPTHRPAMCETNNSYLNQFDSLPHYWYFPLHL